MESDTTNNRITTIRELNGMSFFIPSCQRGYRWKKTQTEELLSDIAEFIEKHKEGDGQNEKYRLQPLVLKLDEENGDEENGKWRVVDGQQRLTTVYLVLKYFESTGIDTGCSYTIEYENFKRQDFFDKINTITEDSDEYMDSIDQFHIFKAYETIKLMRFCRILCRIPIRL